jgi:hypothetical protein
MRRRLKRSLLRSVVAAAIIAIPGAAAVGAGATTSTWTVTTVASGLDAPRGIAFLPNGTLLVAEAGHGGDVCRPDVDNGVPLTRCIGTTSRISSVNATTGARATVVSGLFSMSGLGVTGADGLAVRGGQIMTVLTDFPQRYASWTCTGQPADCNQVLAAARAQAGTLVKATPSGAFKVAGKVGEVDYAWTQTHTQLSNAPPNSNPYGLLPLPRGTFVADAGSNTLDFVSPNGHVELVAGDPLPPPGGFPGDGVPTCVAQAGGTTYVADLAGRVLTFQGTAKTRGKKVPQPTTLPLLTQVPVGAGLLHHVTGCAADRAGNLYLVDMWGRPGPPIPAGPAGVANTGSVVMVAPGGQATVLASGLNFPNQIAVGVGGTLYVSVNSTCPATGSPFPYCASGGTLVKLTHT